MFRPTLIALTAVLLLNGYGPDEPSSKPQELDTKAEAAADGAKTRLSDLRDAEKEGEAHPTTRPPEQVSQAFKRSPTGTDRRECVELPGKKPARSGEFVTEIFYLYKDEKTDEWGAKMPWVPLHLREEFFENEGDVPGVTVRAASLKEPAKIKVREFSGTSGFEVLGEAYPSYIRLPGEGPWRIIVTSGPDWGCFDLEPS